MKLRKRLFCILFTLTLLLCSCARKTPYQPQNMPSPESVPAGEYVYRESTISADSWSACQPSSRGILYLDQDVLSVYSPSAGISVPLCFDPLCSHGLASDCLYRFMIYGSVAAQKNDRLYWYDHDVDLDNMQDSKLHYRICSTDLYGQDFRILYRNSGNYISGIALGCDSLYFTEQIGDSLSILYAMDYNGKHLRHLPYSGEDELVVTSFACTGEQVYYVANGCLSVCDTSLENSRELAEVGDVPLFGDVQRNRVYYPRGNVVFCFDEAEGSTSELLRTEDGRHIVNLCFTSDGICWQELPDGLNPASDYADYTAWLDQDGNNVLWFFDFETGEKRCYPVPEKLYLFQYTVYGDLVFGMKCVGNEATGKMSGHGEFCWNLTDGSVTDVKS